MENIELTDLRGIWLGDDYNLIVGCFDDSNYGSLVIRAEMRIEETRNLNLSDITDNGTRFLSFNEDFEIEIWKWDSPSMTIKIEDNTYDLLNRGY